MLPAQSTIAMGQNEAEVEVNLPANAAPGEKKDVNVLGHGHGRREPAKMRRRIFTVVIEKNNS